MSPEQAIVESLLAALDENVTLLEPLNAVSREDFTSNPRHYLFAERCFQLAIQCLVDVAFRLAADEGWPTHSIVSVRARPARGLIPGRLACAARMQGLPGPLP